MKRTALLVLLAVTPAFAQQQQPKFEIADVRVSPTARGFGQNFGGVLREGHYVNRDATMLNLIEAAYDVSEDNISGGPGWMSLDLFDVMAKVPSGTTPATANLMLQALLADRFGLVTTRGIRPVPRYVLTVGKGGSKLKTASGSGNPSCQPVQQAAAPPADLASTPNIKVACHNLTAAGIADNLRHTENREVTVYALKLAGGKPKLTQADDAERSGCKPDPNAPKPATNVTVMTSCKNTTMADLAQNLQQMANAYIDHPIVDSTGLSGGWDFLIGWTPKAMMQPATPFSPQGAGTTVEAADPNGITVFDAVERELGLKLVKQKQSMPIIVVDHVAEKPIE